MIEECLLSANWGIFGAIWDVVFKLEQQLIRSCFLLKTFFYFQKKLYCVYFIQPTPFAYILFIWMQLRFELWSKKLYFDQ